MDCHDHILDSGTYKCPFCRKLPFEMSITEGEDGIVECRVDYHYNIIIYADISSFQVLDDEGEGGEEGDDDDIVIVLDSSQPPPPPSSS